MFSCYFPFSQKRHFTILHLPVKANINIAGDGCFKVHQTSDVKVMLINKYNSFSWDLLNLTII